jgi:PAS domain S-box-containing protein
MGELMRSTDWSKTHFGPVDSWAPALRTMVSFLLVNRFPSMLRWGPDFCQIYNDAYLPILGMKHPRSLGQRASECWPEIWPVIEPLLQSVFRGGEPTWMEEIQLDVLRHDRLEEAHFAFAYSPVPDETVLSGIGGVLATVHETTEGVVGQRRGLVLRDLGARSGEAKTAVKASVIAAQTLAQHPKDVPFALIYLFDGNRKRALLAAAAGIRMGTAGSPLEIDLSGAQSREVIWPLAETARTETQQFVEDLQQKLSQVPLGPWVDPPRSAAILPIRSNVPHHPAGFLVLGVSSRLHFDNRYRDFYELISSQVATAIANARTYEEEREHARALAEIDRAKTAFFNDVSHEFRTPLTLMLGPLEDEMRENPNGRARLEIAHRNSLRLLKLVNTLTDFARIEAGRIDIVYEPTNLAAVTAELASIFRSTIERAGLRLVVDCPPLSEEVYVDREMWEKIVLNLLSNALKFTFEGEIKISLCWCREHIELSVSDTGVGIPAAELSHIFERFHRVLGTRSRAQEGAGIGLALVKELAKIHGGGVRVRSVEGHGATFTVTVLTGHAHLPAERFVGTGSRVRDSSGAMPFVEEALRWSPVGMSSSASDLPAKLDLTIPSVISRDGLKSTRILFADDNADMRDYIGRLLAERYEVETVADGHAALERILADPPDLVLADVMMPRLDGLGLLRRLRADKRTQTLPVIMLSARVEEEVRIEGLSEGVDDYLTKPFSARELMARVATHLEMARLRRAAVAALHESEKRFRELAGGAPVMIWVMDEHGNTEFANGIFLKYFQVTLEDVTGQRWKDLVHPGDREVYTQKLLAAASAGRLFRAEGRVRRGDGEWRWIDSWAVPRSTESERAPGMVGCSADITDRKRVERELQEREEQLRQANEQLHVLSRRLFQIQEAERRHLARELHDQMGQTLTAAKIDLQVTQSLVERPAIVQRLDDSIAILERLLDQARQLSLELRPPLLDDLGLVPALRWYLDQYARRAGLAVEFFADPALERVDADIETACFRVAQEALTNVVRHARAQTVSVELHRALEVLHLVTRDDGIGFDLTTACQRPSLGLLGIRERVALVGGELDYKSAPGRGTEVHAFFPVQSGLKSEERRL